MANTLSVMTNVLRNVVSKQRIRYKEKGFNLDLAYICDNIIAMGYPADNIEKIYRNRLEDVYKFLEENHSNHYKIYNLCLERSYDINKFHKRVAIYPFEDHNPPTIELIQSFCSDVDTWLKSNEDNVAAVHCKAGKGRTGTMICCYLLYSGLQRTAEDALAYYDEKRTKDKKGVTIPSQRRYVQYFAKLINSELPYEKTTLKLCEIRFSDPSHLLNLGIVNCSIYSLQGSSCHSKLQLISTSTIDFRKMSALDFDSPDLLIAGDIKVELTNKTSKKSIFHFWFNTYFVFEDEDNVNHKNRSRFIYTLNKSEIDDAHKDKEHKCFSEDFKVQMVLSNDGNRQFLKLESRNFDAQLYYNDNHEKPECLVQNINNTSFVDTTTQLVNHSRIPNSASERSLNKSIPNINQHFLRENTSLLAKNTMSMKGISSNKNLDNLELTYGANCKNLGVQKASPKEPLQINSNKFDRSFEYSTINDIVELSKSVQQPSSKNDNSNVNEYKSHLSVGRNNSNTSSHLSNNSTKQCSYEGDWESGR